MKLISIITPLYNAELFISRTIDSVLAQDYNHWEYILIDDCSSDDSVDFIRAKYGGDSRIKVIKANVNGGAGVSRNIGLENARGRFIAFLDADDVWEPRKLTKQLAFMQKNKSAISHTSYSFINEEGQGIPGRVYVSQRVNLRSYMRNTEIGMSTSMINKDIVGDFKLHSMRTRQDTNLWLTLLSAGYEAHGLNEDLVLYRVREGQISGNKVIIAWRTLRLYLSVTNISLIDRLTNYCYYAFNGVFKRLKK
jgi:teichuronic acid biosynthesis glycosyltransferase TuaG